MMVAKREEQRQQRSTNESQQLFPGEMVASPSSLMAVAGELWQDMYCGNIKEGPSTEEHSDACTVGR